MLFRSAILIIFIYKKQNPNNHRYHSHHYRYQSVFQSFRDKFILAMHRRWRQCTINRGQCCREQIVVLREEWTIRRATCNHCECHSVQPTDFLVRLYTVPSIPQYVTSSDISFHRCRRLAVAVWGGMDPNFSW